MKNYPPVETVNQKDEKTMSRTFRRPPEIVSKTLRCNNLKDSRGNDFEYFDGEHHLFNLGSDRCARKIGKSYPKWVETSGKADKKWTKRRFNRMGRIERNEQLRQEMEDFYYQKLEQTTFQLNDYINSMDIYDLEETEQCEMDIYDLEEPGLDASMVWLNEALKNPEQDIFEAAAAVIRAYRREFGE